MEYYNPKNNPLNKCKIRSVAMKLSDHFLCDNFRIYFTVIAVTAIIIHQFF